MSDPFEFTPEERGFTRVDDDSNTLYATDESRDATGNVDREEFAVRGGQGDRKFHAQKLQLDESGKIIGQKTVGSARDREDAVELLESRVRRTTSANFGGFEIGEFNVGNERNITAARQAHLSRSEEAQASDAAKRAPVTTNASRYASQPGELDYPGVDTPSTDPNVLPKDLRQRQRPETTEPPERQSSSETRTFDRARVFSNTTKTEAVERGVSPQPNQGLQPVETEGVTGTSGFERDKMAGEGFTDAGGARSGTVPQGFVDNLAAGRDADLAFSSAESERGSSETSDPFSFGSDQRERDSVSEDDNSSLVTEYGGIPPQNPTTELPGVGDSTADKLESDVGVSTVQEFYENREQAESVLSKQFREEARTVAAYSVGGDRR